MYVSGSSSASRNSPSLTSASRPENFARNDPSCRRASSSTTIQPTLWRVCAYSRPGLPRPATRRSSVGALASRRRKRTYSSEGSPSAGASPSAGPLPFPPSPGGPPPPGPPPPPRPPPAPFPPGPALLLEVEVGDPAANRVLLIVLEDRGMGAFLAVEQDVEDRVQAVLPAEDSAELALGDDDRVRRVSAPVEDARNQALLAQAPRVARA